MKTTYSLGEIKMTKVDKDYLDIFFAKMGYRSKLERITDYEIDLIDTYFNSKRTYDYRELLYLFKMTNTIEVSPEFNAGDPRYVETYLKAITLINTISRNRYTKGMLYGLNEREIDYIEKNANLIPLIIADNKEISNIHVRRHTLSMYALCPFHLEKHPSFKVLPFSNSFFCYGCGTHGNPIDYMTRAYDITPRESSSLLSEIFMFKYSDEPGNNIVKKYRDAILSDDYVSVLYQIISNAEQSDVDFNLAKEYIDKCSREIDRISKGSLPDNYPSGETRKRITIDDRHFDEMQSEYKCKRYTLLKDKKLS